MISKLIERYRASRERKAQANREEAIRLQKMRFEALSDCSYIQETLTEPMWNEIQSEFRKR